MAGLVVVLSCAIVAVTMGVVLTRPEPPRAPKLQPHQRTVLTSRVQPILVKCETFGRDQSRRKSTPQSEASRWLFASNASKDHPSLPQPEAVTRMLHRFALATFFFATGADEAWTTTTGWLDPSDHECLWCGVSCANGTTDAIASCMNQYGIQSVSCRITNATSIDALDLSGNGLTRTLPREIGLLRTAHIKSIKLESNTMAGTIPSEINQLTSLRLFSLIRNKVDGSIPSALGDMRYLESLLLSDNALQETIPVSLSKLDKLKVLDLSLNSLTGAIPTQLGLMTSLNTLVLSRNRLSGGMPSELARLTRLVIMDLSGNSTVILIPNATAMTSLRVLAMGGNGGDLTTILEQTGGQFSTIPTAIGEFVGLTRLEIFSNFLIGSIPTELGRLENLEYLLCNNNYLSGSLPKEMGNLRNLIVWNTNASDISGPLPSDLGRLAALEELLVSGNLHGGNVPSEIGKASALRVWDATDNAFTGPLPTELGQLVALEELSVAGTFCAHPCRPIEPEIGRHTDTPADVVHSRKRAPRANAE